ncbi:hypothetical protein SCUP234_05393 [Seiridium cupressi]
MQEERTFLIHKFSRTRVAIDWASIKLLQTSVHNYLPRQVLKHSDTSVGNPPLYLNCTFILFQKLKLLLVVMEEEYCVVVATKIGITNFQFVPSTYKWHISVEWPTRRGGFDFTLPGEPGGQALIMASWNERAQILSKQRTHLSIVNLYKAYPTVTLDLNNDTIHNTCTKSSSHKALRRALGRAPTQSTITSSLTGQSKIVLASDSRSLQDQKSVSGTSSAARSPTTNPQADNPFIKHANCAKSSTPGIILDTRQGVVQSGAVPVTKSRSHPRTIPEVEMDANGKTWVQTKLSFNPVKPSAHSLENNKRPSETTIEPSKSSTGVLRGSPTKRRKPSTARKSWRGSCIVADSESE